MPMIESPVVQHQQAFIATPAEVTATTAAEAGVTVSSENGSSGAAGNRVNNKLLNALIANTAKSNAAAIIVPHQQSSAYKQMTSQSPTMVATTATHDEQSPTSTALSGLMSRNEQLGGANIAASLCESSNNSNTSSISSSSSSTSSSNVDANNIYAEIEPIDALTTRLYRKSETPPPTSTQVHANLQKASPVASSFSGSESQSPVAADASLNNAKSAGSDDSSAQLDNTLTLNDSTSTTVAERPTGAEETTTTMTTPHGNARAAAVHDASINSSDIDDATLPSFPSASSLCRLTTVQAESVSTALHKQPSSNGATTSSANNNATNVATNGFSPSNKNIAGIGELPPHWEARVDQLGRIFYIDHATRTTTWKRPKMNATAASQQEQADQHMLTSEIEKQRLDKRYQSIRRTINSNNNAANAGGGGDSSVIYSNKVKHVKEKQPLITETTTTTNNSVVVSTISPKNTTTQQPTTTNTLNTTTSLPQPPQVDITALLNQPGARFIMRADLRSLIRRNPTAHEFLKQSKHLKSIILSIQANAPLYYPRYQHNKELVKFINMFSDASMPLPAGWDMKFEKNSKVFFVDHNSRSTTFIDPRLPVLLTPSPTGTLNGSTGSGESNGSEGGTSSPQPPSSNQHITTITTITPPSTLPKQYQSVSKLTPVPEATVLLPQSNGSASTSASLQPPQFPPPPPPSVPPQIQPVSNRLSSTTPSLTIATTTATPTLTYADRVVAFIQQPHLFDLIKRHGLQLSAKQRDKLSMIRQEGRPVYDRMCADLDLAAIVSQLEEQIMSYVITTTTTGGMPSAASSGSISAESAAEASSSSSTGTQPSQAQAAVLSTSQTSSSISSQKSGVPSSNTNNTNNNNRRDYHRGFQSKLRTFYRKLESKGYGQGPQKSKIVIRRDKLLDDARVKFMQLSKHDLRKNKIFLCFHGEEGLDYGGPAREFFYLLSRELFNPYYGLFEYSASDMYTVQISPMSSFQDHVLEWFQFAGRVLGVALIHQYLLDAFFTRPFYKALLKDTNWTLSDLETLDPEYCQSLMWIKENDITDVLELTFSVTEDKCGQLIERDLKENGRNIAVTEKNKSEYVARLIKWRVERGVQKQTEALVKGFYEVVDPKLVQVFDARELELVLCGTVEIDLTDWKRNTDYRSGYHPGHQVVVWFWQAVERFDNEQKLKLLQFVTGTSSIPYEGFSALRGSNGPRKFCIERWGTVDALPRAHTCFNRFDLPPYPSFECLYDKLLLAIEETSGFCIQ